MKSKKFSVIVCVIFCALLAQAQDAPSEGDWSADPLDVIEPPKKESAEPALPEFEEIPAPGAKAKPEPPPPAPEIAPSAPAVEPPAPTVAQTSSSPSEPPDYSKEAKFHSIYKNYNEQPTSEESWEKAVGSRQSEVYKVQKGDTLSGISTTLFGDQFFWPKVWSLNSDKILNPHEIVPGMSVQFFPGSAEDAPTLQLGEQAAAEGAEEVAAAEEVEVSVPAAVAPAAGSGEVVATVATNSDLESTAKFLLPPPKKKTPVLKTLPGSLPAHSFRAKSSPALDVQIEMQPTQFPAPMEYLGYYITDKPLEGVGVVTGAELGLKSAGEYQYIFVRLDGASGKQFLVQKNLTLVPDPQNEKRQGQMVEVQGEIEILEKVNADKNIYRAIVRKVISPVEVGSILTAGKLPIISANGGTEASGVGAKIMGGQFDKKRRLFGTNSLVFLDAGSSAGFQEGQNLSVYADERVRNNKTEALENDRVIGTVKIVRVTPNFATGYVVKAVEDILVGDYVGKAGAQAKVSAPSGEDEFGLEEAAPAPAKSDSLDEDWENSAPPADAAPASGAEDPELEL